MRYQLCIMACSMEELRYYGCATNYVLGPSLLYPNPPRLSSHLGYTFPELVEAKCSVSDRENKLDWKQQVDQQLRVLCPE